MIILRIRQSMLISIIFVRISWLLSRDAHIIADTLCSKIHALTVLEIVVIHRTFLTKIDV